MQLPDLQARIGEHIGTSPWILVDQARIDAFADVTEDHQFIHVDPERAKATPLGGTIAHGFLLVSLLAPMMAGIGMNIEARMSLNYGFDRLRFVSPVHAGKRIRGQFVLLELAEKQPGQWQQKVEVTVEIDGELKPALIADWLFQHFT